MKRFALVLIVFAVVWASIAHLVATLMEKVAVS